MQLILGAIVTLTILIYIAWMGLLAVPQLTGSPGLGDSTIWVTLTAWVELFAWLMTIPGIVAAGALFFFFRG